MTARRARVRHAACTTMVRRGGGRITSRGLYRVDAMRAEVDTRGRLVIIGLVVVALFAGLLTRLWFLQVAGGESLAVAAQANSDEIVQVPALRGRILDVKGRVLAETKAVTALVVDRQKLTADERARLVPSLAHALGITPERGEQAPRQREQPAVRSRQRRRTRHRRPGGVRAGAPGRLPGHSDHVELLPRVPAGDTRRPRARVHGPDQRRGVRRRTRPRATSSTTRSERAASSRPSKANSAGSRS